MDQVKPSLTRPQTTDAEFFSYFFRLRDLLHLFHLGTKSYSAHIASQELYEKLLDSTDEMIEVFQGEKGELLHIIIDKTETLEDVLPLLRVTINYIETNKVRFSPSIINILEDLSIQINKTIYKLQFLK